MNARQWMVTIIIACIVGAASYAASGVLTARRMNAGAGSAMTPVVQYLGLTPAQQNRIRPVDQRFRQDQQAACTEMQEARAALLDVLNTPNSTRADLEAAVDRVTTAQAKMQRQTAEYLFDIRPSLTAGQRQQLFGLVGQRFCGQGRCGAGMCPAGGGGQGRRGRCGRQF